MTQSTADLVVMMALGKPSIKDVKMEGLHKLRKQLNLPLLRGKDKCTHVRAVANSLICEGYIRICNNANVTSLARTDIEVVIKLDMT